MCLDSFQHKFYDTCETVLHLTHEKIELFLPTQEDTYEQGYEIQADKSPCQVTIIIYIGHNCCDYYNMYWQILKSAVDLPHLSRKYKENAKADGKSYPPRIMLTVTYTKSLLRSPDCALRIEGIDEIKAFNMKIPTVEIKPHPMTFLQTIESTGKNNYISCTRSPCKIHAWCNVYFLQAILEIGSQCPSCYTYQ